MTGKTNLSELITNMSPVVHPEEYVFVSLKNPDIISRDDRICEFREKEGTSLIIKKQKADELNITYQYICSWITLEVNSSLQAVGFTAAFSSELAKHNLSCNVIAGYHHDHIFVETKNAQKAMTILTELSSIKK